jgi:hypothetical protein
MVSLLTFASGSICHHLHSLQNPQLVSAMANPPYELRLFVPLSGTHVNFV